MLSYSEVLRNINVLKSINALRSISGGVVMTQTETFTGWRGWRGEASLIAGDVVDLLCKKHKDYGSGNINAFGEVGILVRVSDKIARLKHLYTENVVRISMPSPENESIDDTWLDLAGYAILALMLRRGTFNTALSTPTTSASISPNPNADQDQTSLL